LKNLLISVIILTMSTKTRIFVKNLVIALIFETEILERISVTKVNHVKYAIRVSIK